MSDTRKDGGPAFPHWSGWREGDIQEVESKDGMTLRDYFAVHAPESEIRSMKPGNMERCALYLGIEEDDYNADIHYRQVLAKVRYEWADTMLSERDKS